tara:strand:- start:578 stop:898 length:321 start_codon:yes stop_codon:yes gene_type:complete
MKYLALILGALALVGCSSTSQLVVDKGQYCYTTSTTSLKDGTTSSSQVLVECTDKPGVEFVTGKDGSRCGWARQSYTLKGQRHTSHTMACMLQDGSWTYVPNYLGQ